MPSNSESQLSAQLLQQAQAGDAASLEMLLSNYIGYLKVLSQSQFDQRLNRRLNASDLVQETLLEAHRDFASFSGKTAAEFTGWLRKILIHNAARELETHLVAAKRNIQREQVMHHLGASLEQSHLRLSGMLTDGGRSPSSEVELQEALVAMANAIEELPQEYREVIVLRHLEGLAFKDVAERMHRTPGAARMLWLRAIERLREAMDSRSDGALS